MESRPKEMESSQVEQIKCTEFSASENSPHSSSGGSNADSDQVANLMDFAYDGQVPSVPSLVLVSADGITQETDEPMQATATEEPTRRLRPLSGPAPEPKRFFRSFWRGLSKRAVSREQLKSCMDE